MHVQITDNTLDDLLRKVFEKLLKSKNNVQSSRGASSELDGVLLQLSNPRARLSRTEKKGTLFSCLGELLWYLAGSKDLSFIKHYIPAYEDESEDKLTIYGGYGPRFFNTRGNNQFKNVLTLLKENPESRRAVIQLFDAEDISKRRKEIPCTCTLQFLLRRGQLNMYTHMRSNDAYLGLPHDVFAFTMIQEIMARILEARLGNYFHMVGSLHLYAKHRDDAKIYLDEGFQEKIAMPPVPSGDPWPSIKLLLTNEALIRNGKDVDISLLDLEPYWADLARLLAIYQCVKKEKLRDVVRITKDMHSSTYQSYIRQKIRRKVDTDDAQALLDFSDN